MKYRSVQGAHMSRLTESRGQTTYYKYCVRIICMLYVKHNNNALYWKIILIEKFWYYITDHCPPVTWWSPDTSRPLPSIVTWWSLDLFRVLGGGEGGNHVIMSILHPYGTPLCTHAWWIYTHTCLYAFTPRYTHTCIHTHMMLTKPSNGGE